MGVAMSEEAGQQVAGQPVEQSAAPQPIGQTASVDSGAEQQGYTPDQVNEWKRMAEQYQGARPMVESLVKSGIKTPDQLRSTLETYGQYRQFDETLKARGLDRNTLTTMFGGGQTQQPQGQQPQASSENLSVDTIRQVVGDEIRSIHLKTQHDQSQASEQAAIQRAVSEIVGQDKSMEPHVARLVKAAMAESPAFYDEGHPLADTAFRPRSEQEVAQVAQEVRSMLSALRGGQAVQQAQQALYGAQPKPGGPALQNGQAGDQNPENLPFYMLPREAQIAYATRISNETAQQLSQVPQPMR